MGNPAADPYNEIIPPILAARPKAREPRMTTLTTPETAVREKRRVAFYSLLATLGLLVFKLWVAVASHSLSIAAEAANSGLDLLAAILTWTAIGVAAKPADANHPFGHGKFENFSAFLETGLLVITAILVLRAALLRALAPPVLVHVTWAAFTVMGVSLAVDLWRTRALGRAAARYGSDALEADALNYSSDLWSSIAVLIALGLMWLGQRFGWTALRHADAAAAAAVALAMLYVSLRLGRRTAGALLDEAPAELHDELRARVRAVPGVEAVDQLRLRRSGNRYFMDLRLAMARTLSLERAREVREEVAARIHRRLPDADVVVETQPRRPPAVDLFEQLRAVALRHGANVHDLSVYDINGALNVELHLELDEALSLKEAHDWVSGIESEMRRELPQIRQIVSHIEPERRAAVPAEAAGGEGRIVALAQAAAAAEPGMLDCHNVELRRSSGHLSLSCHCTFPDSMPVGRVHDIVSRFEARLRRELPELSRVTIHTEPGSDNRGA